MDDLRQCVRRQARQPARTDLTALDVAGCCPLPGSSFGPRPCCRSRLPPCSRAVTAAATIYRSAAPRSQYALESEFLSQNRGFDVVEAIRKELGESGLNTASSYRTTFGVHAAHRLAICRCSALLPRPASIQTIHATATARQPATTRVAAKPLAKLAGAK